MLLTLMTTPMNFGHLALASRKTASYRGFSPLIGSRRPKSQVSSARHHLG